MSITAALTGAADFFIRVRRSYCVRSFFFSLFCLFSFVVCSLSSSSLPRFIYSKAKGGSKKRPKKTDANDRFPPNFAVVVVVAVAFFFQFTFHAGTAGDGRICIVLLECRPIPRAKQIKRERERERNSSGHTKDQWKSPNGRTLRRLRRQMTSRGNKTSRDFESTNQRRRKRLIPRSSSIEP